MSNARSVGNGHYSLDRFRAEAKATPFVLDVSTDRTITIPVPNTDAMFDAEEAMRKGEGPRAVISALCGSAADDVMDVFGAEQLPVTVKFAESLAEHFGLGE